LLWRSHWIFGAACIQITSEVVNSLPGAT
jgi:hypothetical protein